MKRPRKNQRAREDDMRPEYDFTGGVRGKHHKLLEQGYTIRIHKTDGTVVEKLVSGKGAITLAPDVQEFFPSSEAVNHALRTLIALVPATPRKASEKQRRTKKTPRSLAKKMSPN